MKDTIDMPLREILSKKAMLKASIENLIQVFTNETGIVVSAVNLDSYAKHDIQGNLLESNVNVSVALRL